MRGFQSFEDSGDVLFTEGFNLVIGQNNSGKSSFLKALRVPLVDDRHRRPDAWETGKLPMPSVEMTISLSGAELKDSLMRTGGPTQFPKPPSMKANEYLDYLTEADSVPFGMENNTGGLSANYGDKLGLLHSFPDGYSVSLVVNNHNGSLSSGFIGNTLDASHNLVSSNWQSKVFFFDAQRLNIGFSPVGHSLLLTSNASNLPVVLATMASDRPDVFDNLVRYLRQIFTSVGHLSTRINPSNPSQFEVRVWPTEERERIELSFALEQSGTGIAQVIALLAAVMTKQDAVLVIDEINSFLHPAAVKSLLRILENDFNRHQYIISTHAPEVIGFGSPGTIHLVRREGYESRIDPLNRQDVEQLRVVASTLGASMSDVFAAERVIWVEGESEEAVFPYLYSEYVGVMPRGTSFTPVVSTGDLQGGKKRTRELAYEIYKQLSSAVATLPVKVLFGFDSETLSDEQKAAMVRESGGRLNFLPRRHLECYLVHPEAIADRINTSVGFQMASSKGVEKELMSLASDIRYGRNWVGNLRDDTWLATVDAANLISKTIQNLSDQRTTFVKTRDTLEMAKYIRAHDTDFLLPLISYIEALVISSEGD